MKKQKTKLLALMLVMVLGAGLLPPSIFAADNEEESVLTEETQETVEQEIVAQETVQEITQDFPGDTAILHEAAEPEASQNENAQIDSEVTDTNLAATEEEGALSESLMQEQYEENDLSLSSVDVTADGYYSVSVNMLQANSDNTSMAANALDSTAYIRTSNGASTIYLTWKTISLSGIEGNITAMSYYTQPQTSSGTWDTSVLVDATIASYRDHNGTQVPEKIQFQLPYTDNGTYYVMVTVDAMEIFGSGQQNARLIVDYSTLAAAEDDSTNKGTDEETNNGSEDNTTDTNDTDTDDTDTNTDTTNTSNTNTTTNTNSTTLDKDNLADGIYEVGVKIWNETQDQASMAASALKGTARIVVSGSTKTMYLYTQPMTLGTITASLIDLKVENGSGGYTAATVQTKDSDGNPTSFSFTMPHTNEYISIMVNPHVEAMGNTDIGARLKVDYSTLAKVSSSTDLSQASTTNLSSTSSGTTSSTSSSSSSTAKTSDRYNISLWMVMMAASAVLGAALFMVYRKDNYLSKERKANE